MYMLCSCIKILCVRVTCTGRFHRNAAAAAVVVEYRFFFFFYPSFPGLFPRAVHDYLQSDPIKRALLLVLMLLLELLPIARGGPDDATLDHDDDDIR